MTRTPTYTVAGQHPVLGRQPGEPVDVTGMPAEQLARMVARGSLTVTHHEAVRVSDGGKEQD